MEIYAWSFMHLSLCYDVFPYPTPNLTPDPKPKLHFPKIVSPATFTTFVLLIHNNCMVIY